MSVLTINRDSSLLDKIYAFQLVHTSKVKEKETVELCKLIKVELKDVGLELIGFRGRRKRRCLIVRDTFIEEGILAGKSQTVDSVVYAVFRGYIAFDEKTSRRG